MLKMDTHTKQIFLSGCFAYFTTVTAVLWHSNKVDAVQDVQIQQLTKSSIAVNAEVKQLSAALGALKTDYATLEVVLLTIDKSVKQLDKTTQSLLIVTTKLEERVPSSKG